MSTPGAAPVDDEPRPRDDAAGYGLAPVVGGIGGSEEREAVAQLGKTTRTPSACIEIRIATGSAIAAIRAVAKVRPLPPGQVPVMTDPVLMMPLLRVLGPPSPPHAL